MRHVLLARYGEIALKGRNRGHFIETLVRNLADRAGSSTEVRAYFGRVLLFPAVHDVGLPDRVRRTFGVVSVSPAVRVAPTMEAILAAAEQVMGDALAARPAETFNAARPADTFKVETRRADKRFPRSSMEVSAAVGAHLQRRFPLRVDVTDPAVTVSVEIRDQAYLYTETLAGPGGLPTGTGGRAVALLSGGIDSPVATWMAAKRGLTVIPLHCHAFPFTSERSRLKALDLCRVLTGYTGPLRVWVAFFTEIQRAVQLAVPAPLRVTVLRRMMIRLAERVAAREDALALVTGESVGQVASQTLHSIRAIEAVTTLPVLRPVIGMDKTEITAQARVIGTYDLSVLPYPDCCSLFVPAHPRTHPTLAEAVAAEAGLQIDALLDEAVDRSEILEIDARPTAQPAGVAG